MTPGQRGRLIGRELIAIGVLWSLLTWFLFVASPGSMGGGMRIEPVPLRVLASEAGPLVVAIAGQIAGLIWMIRIYRADPEPDQHAWRYRNRDRGSWIVGRSLVSMTPGQRGRWIGRGLIAIALLAIGSAVVWFLAAPGHMGGPFSAGPPFFFGVPLVPLTLVAGVAGLIGGLVWMIRIHRADPEPDQHAWRYRSRGR